MNFFSSLFQNKTQSNKQERHVFISRLGKSVRADDAFFAWSSGDLNQMLKAGSTRTNHIDRHFLLQSIVKETYKLRKEEKYRKLCIEYAKKHLLEFPAIAPVLKKDFDGILPRISTFQHYATVLTENNQYEKAISICKKAIEYGLYDNTQSGYEGRIARIKKKMKKSPNKALQRTVNRR